MIFNKYSELKGLHAQFGASKYHWINYDQEKMERVFESQLAAQKGTALHQLANDAINLGVKLQGKGTVAAYVNDAIGYRMTSEQILFYSHNFFGTADAISFRRNKLRIHDLKTGVTPTSHHQLEVYAALFCLEYRFKPFEIEMELRIYQNNEVRVYEADPDFITHIMSQIQTFDRRINEMRMEARA